MVLDAEPLQKLLVKINQNSDSPQWAEGLMTLDSGASISVISRKFASLSNICVEKIQHSLQLVNASGAAMKVDGVVCPLITLTNGRQIRLGPVIVSPDLSTEHFLVCTRDMIKLGILPDRWPFNRKSGGLHDIGNRGWMPIQVSTETVSKSYFNSVNNVNYVKSVDLNFQTQYVYNACFGFRAKFQNNNVSESFKFCNHKNVNNICCNYVNNEFQEISVYNCVLSMDKSSHVSTELGHQNDHIQSNVENSTPKLAPSLLFEASGTFFGVVYNDVSQETSCDSSTSCPTVGSIECANVAISKNSTSGGSKNGSKKGVSQAQMTNMSNKKASKSFSYNSNESKVGQESIDDSQAAPVPDTSFRNSNKNEKCVKNSKHNFEHRKCPTGGTFVPTDSENFDVWNSLGSIQEIPNYVSLHESIKKCIQTNSDVFCSKLTSLRHIKTEPITISIRGGGYSKPKPCYRARPIPAHWFDKGRSILADLEEQGLIVRVTEASEYCSPCFFIAKPHDPSQPRLVVDYSLINDIILRPVFPLASPEMVWRRVPVGKGKWWISNDLTSSYWQVRISEESQAITTFISEFGRYRWCVFPQGLSCSGDEFGQRLEIILSNYPKFRNFLRVVDDIAVYGESLEELLEQFSLFLHICRENHLTLSPKKFQMCDPEHSIKFAGMVLSSKGLSPDPDKMSAIRDFPIPKNRTDLRSWMGLCQQFSIWYPELAACQTGLRHLVREDVPFEWSLQMTEQMEATKLLLCGDVYVHPYDTKLVPTIFVDGSILHGAGYILVQQEGRVFSADDYKPCLDVVETPHDGGVNPQFDTNVEFLGKGGGEVSLPIEGGETSPTHDSICDDGGFDTETKDCMVSKGHTSTHGSVSHKGKMRLIRAGSCMSKSFWQRLSPMEVEFLSLYFAILSCDFYLRGCPFVECYMDSSPAGSIFRKPLAELSKRILRMRLELLDYRLRIIYIPGRRQSIADALSRYPTGCNQWPFKDPSSEWCNPNNKIGCNYAVCSNTVDGNDPLLGRFYNAAEVDLDYIKIVKCVASGLRKNELRKKIDKSHPAYSLNYLFDTLRIVKDDRNRSLLFVEDRIYVPKAERLTTLKYLHLSHMGFAMTFSVARSRYFWEGMKADLERHIGLCGPCVEYQSARPCEVELKRENQITSPMEWVGVDLFQFEGSHFLFMVDGFSQFSWFHKFGPCPTSFKVIQILKKWFLEFGSPRFLRVDSGPQFLGPFVEFCEESSITIERASAFNPQSNGTAERNLGILKKLLKKSCRGGDDFLEQFYAMQNMPRTVEGLSPARLFYQREVRSTMVYSPPDVRDELAAGLQRHHDRERQREVRNKRRGRGLESPLDLYVGMRVFLQDEQKRGKPFSIPGKVVSIREGGRSAWIWCPGRSRRFLRNRRKMRTLGEEEEEEDNDDVLIDEDDMVDEEGVDEMENDEVLEALSVGMVILNGTRVPVPQICTLSTEAQLPSALQAVRTAPRPRPSQLTAGGERIRTVRFTLPCYARLQPTVR